MYYISKNDADKAIECLNKALAVQPDNVVVMTYLVSGRLRIVALVSYYLTN